jgi:hypothetical protein
MQALKAGTWHVQCEHYLKLPGAFFTVHIPTMQSLCNVMSFGVAECLPIITACLCQNHVLKTARYQNPPPLVANLAKLWQKCCVPPKCH